MTPLEEVVTDLAREGYSVESTVGDTVIASKRVNGAGTHVLYAAGMVLALMVSSSGLAILAHGGATFVGVILAVAFVLSPLFVLWRWITAATQRVRYRVSVDESGQVVQERLA